jgi:hypothetical protein
MHLRTWLAAALALLATLAASSATPSSNARSGQADDLQALGGRWLYVEDFTEGRPVDKQGPPMSVTFGFRVEEDAVVMLRSQGREEPIALDGSAREVAGNGTTKFYRGEWKGGALHYDIETVRVSDDAVISLLHREFRPTQGGLIVRVVIGDPPEFDKVALYRHPEDIELPTPAKATIADVAWLVGAWGGGSTEERWTPTKGGAMLGVSRTVKGDRMVAFEYLRIVERDGGLVYVAQPGGRSPTEFVLTDLTDTRAVFENPRHDSPQRIVYELDSDDSMSASIGFINGGRPRRFEFKREGS